MGSRLEITGSRDGWLIPSGATLIVNRLPKFPLRVLIAGEITVRQFSLVTVKEREFNIDRITLTLFDPKTGKCMTGSPRIVSDSFKLPKRKLHKQFHYGRKNVFNLTLI